MIGPGEFDADSPRPGNRPWQDSIHPRQILRAYEHFQAHAVYLSDPASQWLAKAGAQTPENFQHTGLKANSRIIDLQGYKIGLVFFGSPPPAQPTNAPDNTKIAPSASRSTLTPRPAAAESYVLYMRDALEEARRLGSQVHLLIGVSPWGSDAEREFLPQAEGLFHLLLGGGPGPSFAFAGSERVSPAPRLIWSRPNPEGRSVTLIKLYEWPQGGSWADWRPEISFESVQMHLTPAIPEDPEVVRLLPY